MTNTKRLAAFSLVLIAGVIGGARNAAATLITEDWTAGQANNNYGNNANIFGAAGPANVDPTNVTLLVTWSTDASQYNCNNSGGSDCVVLASAPGNTMSASMTGTNASQIYTYTVTSNAPSQGTSYVDVYADVNTGGTDVQFYVDGVNFLEAGLLKSPVTYVNGDSAIDPVFMNQVIAAATSTDWFVSSQWNGSTYYPNGGSYFPSFSALQAQSTGTPEPTTWISLMTGLIGLALMKLRRSGSASR